MDMRIGPASASPDSFPNLIRSIESGLVRWDGRQYYGTASDGVEVDFGEDPGQVERYLTDRPTPDRW